MSAAHSSHTEFQHVEESACLSCSTHSTLLRTRIHTVRRATISRAGGNDEVRVNGLFKRSRRTLDYLDDGNKRHSAHAVFRACY
jgi:hypothetical protein